MDDVVVLVLVKTKDFTAVSDTLYGSAVWNGLIFCEEEVIRWLVVAGLVHALDDIVDLSQHGCGGFEAQPGVDVAQGIGSVKGGCDVVLGIDTEVCST